jgi:hypothetical protein
MDASQQSPVIPATELCPAERLVAAFAANEMGAQRKKKIGRHLETCSECRAKVAQHHEMARRYREFERQAIASSAKRH